MDVDSYRIVNVYKPPHMQLQVSDLPVFSHPILYAGDFNCPHVNWGYRTSSANGECLVAWVSLNTFGASCFRDVMSAGQTVFTYTCAQCVVEIKRTKQYSLISKTLQTIC